MYLLVHLHTDGSLGDVPDTTSAAMVELVGHTLMDSSVHLDIDIFANLVGPQISGERDITLLPERPRKEIAGSSSETMTSRHFHAPRVRVSHLQRQLKLRRDASLTLLI